MPDVEGHPIVAKLGRLAGSPTLPPPPHKSPTLALKRRFNVAPRRRGRRRRKQRRLAGGTLGSTGGLQAGGRTGPRRPQAARTGPRRPQAARGIGRLPTQPMCICCLYIYIYICMYMCVFRAGHHNPCRHSILKKLRPRSRQRHPARGRRPKDRGRVLRLRVWWLHQQPHNRAEVSRVWGLPPPKLSGLGGSNPL